jgi:hypothetical protein
MMHRCVNEIGFVSSNCAGQMSAKHDRAIPVAHPGSVAALVRDRRIGAIKVAIDPVPVVLKL